MGPRLGRALCLLALAWAAMALTACGTTSGHGRWEAPTGLYGQAAASPNGWRAPAVATHGPAAKQKIGRPYQINGTWYVPAREDDYKETGIASWYGPGFHGKATANGERFDENQLTAAHTTLPLPSLVRVTNHANGRSMVVRVNDRGPFANDRIIDLSKAAANELGFIRQGTAKVTVEYVGPAPASGGSSGARVLTASAASPPKSKVSGGARYVTPTYKKSVQPRGLYVQVASFTEKQRADEVVRQLGKGGPVYVEKVRVDGHLFHRVIVGPWPNDTAAHEALAAIADLGFPGARVVKQK